ncbi:flagellinolysin [Paenibacillus sp. GCM10027628]|uniref:flagellinolysin n=1 Tax=Paenibacillus sp. GCM10027628 TaxID=3273413 RepID=UPI003637E01A
MRINHNLSALSSWRMNKQNNNDMQSNLEKLSSGQRINKAGDDAAGLSISEKMRGQIRGLGQASRNIQDGISLIQTAEGGLNEIHSLLQRGRELAVQAANDTYTTADKTNLQAEVSQIVKEVDRIASTTDFNTINLLNTQSALAGSNTVVTNLKGSWLKQSVDRIQTYYGISPDNTNLQINVVQGAPGGVLAYVSSMVNGLPGVGTNVSLNIELADYDATTNTIGGLSADRTIAHEMTHAVMARTMNWSEGVNGTETSGISTWFKEGTAEFIHGADERALGDLTVLGGNTAANRQTIVNDLGSAGAAWVSDSAHYSSAYTAIRYMHASIKAAGGAGIKDVIDYLSDSVADPGHTRTLDQAISFIQASHAADPTVGIWNGVAGFKADFAANGAAFMATMNLADMDTGAIGGANADGGAVLTDTTVINDTVNSGDPTPFNEIYPSTSSTPLKMQVGANDSQTLDVGLTKVDSSSLGISNVSLVIDTSGAIDSFENAISSVSAERARFGALQNRLEHTLAVTENYNDNLSSSESRIRDTDMASQMMQFSKASILSQASMAMLAQANQAPQAILQLIR